jgi:hypothetical protein
MFWRMMKKASAKNRVEIKATKQSGELRARHDYQTKIDTGENCIPFAPLARANDEGQNDKRLTFCENALADFEIMRFMASNTVFVK